MIVYNENGRGVPLPLTEITIDATGPPAKPAQPVAVESIGALV